MERGIKIAIIAACLVSLGLGLLWDKVIDGARGVMAPTDKANMGPDKLVYSVGDTRLPPVREPAPAETVNADNIALTPATPTPTASPASSLPAQLQPAAAGPTPDTYVVKKGDSWWKIAHIQFKTLGKDTDVWQKANAGVQLKPGATLNVPK